MRTEYDLVFGMGASRSCTETLRRAGLQYLSFPFDWMAGGSLSVRTSLLVTRGEGLFDPSNLTKQLSPEWLAQDSYRHASNGIVFNYDFRKGVPLTESLPGVVEKYTRRFDRLVRLIAGARNVLVVWLSTPDAREASEDEMTAALKILQERFPAVTIDLLCFRFAEGISVANRRERTVGEHITVQAFDYRDPSSAENRFMVDESRLLPCLTGLSVADYRTAAEKAAYRRAKRLARYSRYHATNLVQFTIRRMMSHVRDGMGWFCACCSLGLRRPLFGRIQRRHAAFLSLGYNCELAFRYFKSHGFVDSGLFQWAASESTDSLISAIERLDLMFSGEIEGPDPMYRCVNTRISQHGKAPTDALSKSNQTVDLDADREDLRGRMAHLKKKFVSSLQAGQALVAYKIRTAEYLDPSAETKLNRLIDALRNLGMRDATFLLVCEENCRGKKVRLDWPDVQVRFVRSFNPDACVTDADCGDPVGWKLIFREFTPLVIKKQKHKFKFEK